MRCTNHADRIATRTCDICGAHHCDECLSDLDGSSVCSRCRPAAQAAALRGAARSADDDRARPRWRNPLALGLTAAVLMIGLVLLAVVPGPSPEPEPVWTAPDQRAGRNALAVAALERAAIAVETYHAEHSSYPTSWDDLVPDLAPTAVVDPWSDDAAALVLRTPDWDPTALVLYSIGPDGRDDGGRVYAPETGLGDLVYLVR